MRTTSQSGFTLLEMLIVVSIIGILATLFASPLLEIGADAKRDAAVLEIKRLEGVLAYYRSENGSYPSTEQGLVALVEAPTTPPIPARYRPRGYAKRDQLDDPWTRPFVFTSPGERNPLGVDLCSLGPDGRESADDICNYDASD